MTDKEEEDVGEALFERYDELDQSDMDPEDAARLGEMVREMTADDTLDFESSQRQDEGWLKFYVECPDCEVPMARTTVESSDGGQVGNVRRSTSEIRAICPECKEVMTVLEIVRKTGPFEDLS